MRGWVNYFRVGNSSECFGYIKDWAEKKIRRHLMRARNRRGFGWTYDVPPYIYDLSLSIVMVFMTNGPRLYVIIKAARPMMMLYGGGKIPPRNMEAIDIRIVIPFILGFSSIIFCRRYLIVFILMAVIIRNEERTLATIFFHVFTHQWKSSN